MYVFCTKNKPNVLFYFVFFCPQAYPEYLITYQIVKPEILATPAATPEQKS